MKVLYAIQATGNGHISRARDIIPLLKERCALDILTSGTESEVQLGSPVDYRLKGLSFCYNQTGGLNYTKSLKRNFNLRALREMHSLPIKKYDLLINDFEPISAWAANLRGVPAIAMGHQASFLSPHTPRPSKKQFIGESFLKYFAPAKNAIGFHFNSYDHFIYPPIIRKDIRERTPRNQGYYTIYLPALGDDFLLHQLHKVASVEWHVFSKYTNKSYRKRNVWVRPVSNSTFIRSFANCTGLLTGGGFETPAEALFWGKKLMVMPIKGQYEQQCNAAALAQMGVPVIHKVDANFSQILEDWLNQPPLRSVNFPDNLKEIVEGILGTKHDPIPIEADIFSQAKLDKTIEL